MPQKHKVKQGECLSSIAKNYGFIDYKTIYDDPANASFKQKRPNPNTIFPGDVIVIPDNEVKEVDKPTEQAHKFVLNKEKVTFRLIVKDETGNPIAGRKYDLKIDDVSFSGSTDGSGKLVHEIAADAISGELAIHAGEGEDQNGCTVFSLDLGKLDPVQESTGVQARLNNLGFDCGEVDGIIGPLTQHAIKEFQGKNGLPITGSADTATKNKLAQLHDWE